MKKIIISIIVFLNFLSINAQVAVSVDDLTIAPGETKELTINLNNSVDVNGLQFDLYIPNGFTIETNEPYRITMGERAKDHITTIKEQETGAVRFLVVSMKNEVIKPGTDAVMTLFLTASENAAVETYKPNITGITISHSRNQKLVLNPITWNCTVNAENSVHSIKAETNNANYLINGIRTEKQHHGINVVKSSERTKKVVVP